MTNKPNGTLYIGITNNLFRRVHEHKSDMVKNSFTTRYSLHKLVYYEMYNYVLVAINREKNMKKWRRAWKIELIESFNPEWKDLDDDILGK